MINRGLCLLFGLVLLAGCSGQSWDTLDVTGVLPELRFELTDEQNNPVTAADYHGDVVLVYFGFTHCPDICPLTLSRLAMVSRQLTPQEREELTILFVSVDPQRDRPHLLANYTSVFGPEFVGLMTDESANLDALVRRFRVTYSYGEPDEYGAYDVNHASAIFAFNREGRARLVIRDSDSDEALLNDLRRLIARN